MLRKQPQNLALPSSRVEENLDLMRKPKDEHTSTHTCFGELKPSRMWDYVITADTIMHGRTFNSLAAMVRTDTAPASGGVLDQPTTMPEDSGGHLWRCAKWRGSSWLCDADNLITRGTDVACILSTRPSKPGEPTTCFLMRLHHDNWWHTTFINFNCAKLAIPPGPTLHAKYYCRTMHLPFGALDGGV